MNATTEQLEQQLAATNDIEERASLLIKMSNEFLAGGADNHRAFECASQALVLAESLRSTTLMADSLYAMGMSSVRSNDYSNSDIYFTRACELFDQLGNKHMKAHALHAMSSVRYHTGGHDEAMQLVLDAKEIFDRLGDVRGMMLTLNALGTLYQHQGKYPEALQMYKAILDLDGREAVELGLGKCYHNIGGLYLSMHEPELALQYLFQSLELRKKVNDNQGEVGTLQCIGMAYNVMDQDDKAIEYLEAGRKIAEAMCYREILIRICASLAAIYKDRCVATSLSYYRKALAIAKEIGSKLYADIYINISTIALAKGQIAIALTYAYKALDSAHEIGHRQMLYAAAHMLSHIYEKAGDMAQAFSYYKQYAEIKEEVLGQEKQHAVLQLQKQLDIEKAEREKELYKVRSENMRLEMNQKTSELAATALQLVQKNEFLNRFTRQVTRIVSTHTNRSSMISALLCEVQDNIGIQRDRQQFEQQCSQVHHDFITALSQVAFALNPAELKVCALLRTGLSTKEIAELLYLSERTVSDHRSSIRKKLALNADDDLAAYLGTIVLPH